MADLSAIKHKHQRPTGALNRSKYKWDICMYDTETKQMKQRKFSTIAELNEEWNMKLNSDYVRRIITGYRADASMRNKENSFLARYGHIKITKINEIRGM